MRRRVLCVLKTAAAPVLFKCRDAATLERVCASYMARNRSPSRRLLAHRQRNVRINYV